MSASASPGAPTDYSVPMVRKPSSLMLLSLFLLFGPLAFGEALISALLTPVAAPDSVLVEGEGAAPPAAPAGAPKGSPAEPTERLPVDSPVSFPIDI